MDHNYICNKESDYRFYKNGIHQKNEDERLIKDSSRTKHVSLGMYKIFSQYELLSDNSDTKILNTSKDTLLDVFKYVTLKTLFNNFLLCSEQKVSYSGPIKYLLT